MKKTIYNKPLPTYSKKIQFTTGQKVGMSFLLGAVIIAGAADVITQLYNYINSGDSTEIKFQQKEELFPSEDEFGSSPQEDETIQKQNTNFSYNRLKLMLRPQIEEKLGFAIEGDFDVMGAFEINLISDAFESKDTRLCVLIKPQNGGLFCVYYNNKNSTIEIEKDGSQSDIVSSLVAHLQSSSIENFSINDDFAQSIIQNLPEQNILLVGDARTYIEKSGEKSYMIPVFVQDGDKICVKTYKALQHDIEKNMQSLVEASDEEVSQSEALKTALQEALASVLFGDEIQFMQEYSNTKQQDLTHVNEVLDTIRNDKTQQTTPSNKDLFPDDEFEFLESEITK